MTDDTPKTPNVPATPKVGLFTSTTLPTGSGSSFSQRLAVNRQEQAAQGLATGRAGPGGAAGYLQLDRTGLGWFDGTGIGRKALNPQTVWAIPVGAIQRLVIGWNPGTNKTYHKALQPLEAPLPDLQTIPIPAGCRPIEIGYSVPMVAVWGPDKLPPNAPTNAYIWESSTGGTKDAIEVLGAAYDVRHREDVERGAEVALVRLEQSSYQNRNHGGVTWKPLLNVLGWCMPDPDDLLDVFEDLGLGPEPGNGNAASPDPVRSRPANGGEAPTGPAKTSGKSNRRPRQMPA